MILLDTHVAVWLYEGDFRRIPADVQQRIDRESTAISPYVRLEIAYLYEAGKITATADQILGELSRKLELGAIDSSVATVCRAAMKLAWTRDPFDRLICAHSLAAELPLVTKDRNIRSNLSLAWWGW